MLGQLECFHSAIRKMVVLSLQHLDCGHCVNFRQLRKQKQV